MTAILKVDTIQDTAGNNIINESSDTITIGAAGDTVTVPGTEVKSNKLSPASGTGLQLGDSGDTITIPSGATITNSGTASGFGGITVADQWRVTAASSTSGQVEIDSNWERVDSRGLGTIGTAMTESSGIFSFPSTGVYVVTINVKSYQGSGDQRYVHAYILSTTDNSSYDRVAESSMWFTSAGDSGSKYGSSTCNVLFDVTNTSTHKIKFRKNSEATITTEGDTDINLTFATFIRLGDT